MCNKQLPQWVFFVVYRKRTMQDTVGMLVRERIVSRKLTRNLEGREILLDNQKRRVGKGGGWGSDQENAHG